MGVIKINDYINLDIDDAEGTLEKVKYFGTVLVPFDFGVVYILNIYSKIGGIE